MAEELRIVLTDSSPQRPPQPGGSPGGAPARPAAAAPLDQDALFQIQMAVAAGAADLGRAAEFVTQAAAQVRVGAAVPPPRVGGPDVPRLPSPADVVIEGRATVHEDAGRARPELPRFLEEADLRDAPDVATKRATDRAIAAGLPDDEIRRLQDEANRYANEHTTNRGTVYNRELLRATQAGASDEDARRRAEEAVAGLAGAGGGAGKPPGGGPYPLVPAGGEPLLPVPVGRPGGPTPVVVVEPITVDNFPEALPADRREEEEPFDLAGWIKAAQAGERGYDAYDFARRQMDPEYAGRAARRDAGSISGSLGQLGVGSKTGGLLGQASRLLPAEAQAGLSSALGGAAAGPIGAAVQVAMMVKDAIKEGIAKVGEAGGRAAALDTGVLFDTMTGAMEKLGPMGEIAAEATKAVKQFADGLSMTAQRLAPFNASLATAQAMAGVRQTVGDIRRADLLGPDLAKFVESRSRLEDRGQDLLANLIKPLIPAVTAGVDHLTQMVEALNGVVVLLNEYFQKNDPGFWQGFLDGAMGKPLLKALQKIEKNTRKEEEQGDFLTKFLAVDPAQGGIFDPMQQQAAADIVKGGPLFPGLAGGAFGGL